jgi:hypothetical protein
MLIDLAVPFQDYRVEETTFSFSFSFSVANGIFEIFVALTSQGLRKITAAN